MNARRFKLFTLLALLLLNGCSTPRTMFVYNFSGETIELVLTNRTMVNNQFKTEVHTETLQNKTYGIYNAGDLLSEHVTCGFEISFFKNGKRHSYTYDDYNYIQESCTERGILKYGQGYYVVIAATGVFIKGADGQWIPMIPQRERPAATPSASMAATS
jgi:hypothetical protein